MPNRVSEPVLAGVGGFVVGALGLLMLSGHHLPVPPPAGTAGLAVGVGLLVAVGFAGLAVVLGRVNRRKRDLLRWMLRSGRLPDVDDALLRPILRERDARLSTWRWSWLALGVLQLLLAGSGLVAQGTVSAYELAWRILYAAFWVAVVVAWTVRARWERPRVRRLLDELDRRTAQPVDA